ncbi:MAG: phosphotransferase [Anaerolineae bacterium]|nr:phosphotransferase [Anaerolineae bacterium]MDW8171855.1 phosphotransferase [Anaerolineae bacterium]
MTHNANEAQWLAIARRALDAYGLGRAECRILARTHNVVFLAQDGPRRYVLRLHTYALNTHRLRAEIAWLSYLAEVCHLPVPHPLYTRDGAPYALAQDDPQMIGVLFVYQEGQEKPLDALDSADCAAIGRLLARLHRAAQDFSPTPDSDLPRLDYNGLFGEGGRYALGGLQSMLSDAVLEVMQQVGQQARRAFEALGQSRSSYGLIHGDLHQQNVLFHQGQARALDFEYCGWGYFLYDFAPLLWQLKLRPEYAALEQALWEGYHSLLPLPSAWRDHLETLVAARHVASIRWLALNHENPSVYPHAQAMMEQRAAELRHFLAEGRLERAPFKAG